MSWLSHALGLDRDENKKLRDAINKALRGASAPAVASLKATAMGFMTAAGIPPDMAQKAWDAIMRALGL